MKSRDLLYVILECGLNVYGFVLVGVEVKDKPEVFKYLWHSCNIFIYCLQIYELFPILPNKRGKKSKSFWHFARLIVSLQGDSHVYGMTVSTI